MFIVIHIGMEDKTNIMSYYYTKVNIFEIHNFIHYRYHRNFMRIRNSSLIIDIKMRVESKVKYVQWSEVLHVNSFLVCKRALACLQYVDNNMCALKGNSHHIITVHSTYVIGIMHRNVSEFATTLFLVVLDFNLGFAFYTCVRYLFSLITIMVLYQQNEI